MLWCFSPAHCSTNRLILRRIFRILYDMKKCRLTTCLLLIGVLLFNGSCSNQKTSEKSVTNVRLFTVRNASTMTVQDFPGRVVAAEEVDLAFKVSGTLSCIAAEEGSRIAKGQLVAEMDPRDYQLQFDAAEAEYLSVRAEAERVMALYADSVSTADAYDKARYGLKQVSAKYENARNQLADTRIYAPFNGYVQKRFFDPPTVVSAGMPVVSIVSEDRQEIEINISASAYLMRNEIASFTTSFDFIPGKSVHLDLVSMAPKANANQLYTVRLALPAGLSPQPSPGMNAMVNVAFKDTVAGRTEIPSSALFRQDGQTCAWVYDEKNGTIEKRTVDVESLDSEGNAVVEKGLSAGERIVVAGVHKLTDGMAVKPVNVESETNVGDLL